MAKGYALVLGGGGAKGAYQIGAWKALREANIRIQAIFGTSVGAINACLIGQGDYFRAEQLWSSLTISQILDIPQELILDGKLNLTPKTIPLLRTFLHTTFKEGGLNTQPLVYLIKSYLNEEKLRKSGIDIGLVSLQLDTLQPLKAFLSDTKPGTWADYLLASAAFPGFKSPKIGTTSFIDGGLYNNLPHELARQRGYRRIIVVDNSGLGNNRPPQLAGTETIYIKNTMSFGGEFDFTPHILRNWMKLGYYDALHALDLIDGQLFFYRKNPKALAKFHSLLKDSRVLKHITQAFQKERIPFREENWQMTIRENLPQELALLPSLPEALMEHAASSLAIPRLFLYEWHEWETTIKKHLYNWAEKTLPPSHVLDFFTNKHPLLPMKVMKILFLAQDKLLTET